MPHSSGVAMFASAVGSAVSTAWFQAAVMAAPPSITALYSVGAAVFGAGVSWATMRWGVKAARERADLAHTRITNERNERMAAVRELKGDVQREFGQVREQMARDSQAQTTAIVTAIAGLKDK